DARRRAVDELVAARVVEEAVGAWHARPPPHDSSVAEKTQGGSPHGTQEKDDGSPSRSQRTIRKPRPPAPRVGSVRGGGDVDRYQKKEGAGPFSQRFTA